MRRGPSFVAFSLAALLAGTAAVPAGAQTPAAPRTLQLSFDSGTVTLVANGVTLSEILTEWQRQGGSTFLNIDRVPTSGPLTYEFHNVPDAAVMQSLLREAAGVIIAPRRPGGPVGASSIEQVIVLAASRPTIAANALAVQTLSANPTPIVGRPDDDIPPAAPSAPANAPAPPPAPAQPGSTPNVGTGTSSTPGVVIAPVKPGTPVPPGTIIK
jgi:hypothetical protein